MLLSLVLSSLRSPARKHSSTRILIPQLRFHSRIVRPSGFRMPSPPPFDVDKSTVLVFGAGNFGSCLADHLGDSSHKVYMWSRSEELVKHFNQSHRNVEVLKEHQFAESITAIGPEFPSEELIRNMDVLLFAIPTEGVR